MERSRKGTFIEREIHRLEDFLLQAFLKVAPEL